jgi:hypothetical protein
MPWAPESDSSIEVQMGKAGQLKGLHHVMLGSFVLCGALAVGCGGDDGDGGTSSGSGTGTTTGSGTGTSTGSGTGTTTGTGGGTGTGTATGTATGTGGGMGACTPDPTNPCEVCAYQECPTEADACCMESGCLDVVNCALETGCTQDPNPLACYEDNTCKSEIDAAGGPLGAGTTAAQDVGDCTVAAAEAATSGPCMECNQMFMQ